MLSRTHLVHFKDDSALIILLERRAIFRLAFALSSYDALTDMRPNLFTRRTKRSSIRLDCLLKVLC